jgi:hypothetical protein
MTCRAPQKKSQVMQYADDTSLLIKSKKFGIDFRAKVETATDAILGWFHDNRLMVNVRKCKVIVFGKRRTEMSNFRVGQQVVVRSDVVVYLGLHIDSRLDWYVHINYVVVIT